MKLSFCRSFARRDCATMVCDCSRSYRCTWQSEPIVLPVVPRPFQPAKGWQSELDQPQSCRLAKSNSIAGPR